VHLSDLETLLQLNYLYFKAPRHDSEAFNSFISQLSKHCDSVRNKPASIYNDSIQRLISGNNPRFVGVPTQAQINRIRHDHTMQIFRDRFADASDFKFVMVGKFDVRAVTPLLETYIGGLPSRQRKETWRDVTTRFPNGISVINISEIDGKRSQGSISMGGDFRWSLKEILVFDIFKEILETNVKAALEKEQIDLDYLSVSGMLYRYPHSQYSLNFVWQSSAKDVNNIAITLFEEAQKMKAQATELALLDYIKENQINTHKEQIETNDYWHTVLLNIYQQGDRPQSHEDYVKLVNSIRPSDIRRAARTYFTETKYIMGRLISAE
jgi:zinc protease